MESEPCKDIEWLYSDNKVRIGVTLRDGSMEDRYAGFNLCHYTGDDINHVIENRRRLARICGVGEDRIVVPRQVHGVEVAVIDRQCANYQPDGVDAVVTSLTDVVIGINTADCVPVIITDKSTDVKGAIHAGWRGAVNGIVKNAVKCMRTCGAEDLMAVIGPCIHQCCFEVGEDVAAYFPEEFVSRNYGVRPHVDLPGYVKRQLAEVGVKVCENEGGCTMCGSDSYYSARRLGIESGRCFTFVASNEGYKCII